MAVKGLVADGRKQGGNSGSKLLEKMETFSLLKKKFDLTGDQEVSE